MGRKNPQQSSRPGICPPAGPSAPFVPLVLHSTEESDPSLKAEDYRSERSLCCPGNPHVVLSHWCPAPPAKGQGGVMILTHPRLSEQQGLWGWGLDQ